MNYPKGEDFEEILIWYHKDIWRNIFSQILYILFTELEKRQLFLGRLEQWGIIDSNLGSGGMDLWSSIADLRYYSPICVYIKERSLHTGAPPELVHHLVVSMAQNWVSSLVIAVVTETVSSWWFPRFSHRFFWLSFSLVHALCSALRAKRVLFLWYKLWCQH